MSIEFALIGLGNPGKKYEKTRHNIGFMSVECIFDKMLSSWSQKFKADFAHGDYLGKKIGLLKPQTFMNLSGESVRPLCDFYKIPLEKILVIHDELDLPFGCLAVKNGGGLAGHNGLKSLAQHLGSQDFPRLRLGIGRPAHGAVADFVLNPFQGDEVLALEGFLKGSVNAIDCFLSEGLPKAQNAFNKKSFVTL
jgi:peptidyl-tRNA hydrolase, PTH1 family